MTTILRHQPEQKAWELTQLTGSVPAAAPIRRDPGPSGILTFTTVIIQRPASGAASATSRELTKTNKSSVHEWKTPLFGQFHVLIFAATAAMFLGLSLSHLNAPKMRSGARPDVSPPVESRQDHAQRDFYFLSRLQFVQNTNDYNWHRNDKIILKKI